MQVEQIKQKLDEPITWKAAALGLAGILFAGWIFSSSLSNSVVTRAEAASVSTVDAKMRAVAVEESNAAVKESEARLYPWLERVEGKVDRLLERGPRR